MAVTGTVKSLGIIARLGRNAHLPVGDLEFWHREGDAFLELPGPTRYPVRPCLEPACNGHGIAARLMDGRGKVAPGVVLFGGAPRFVPLAQAPLAVSLRNDGKLWAYSKDQLGLYDFDGNLLSERNVSGYFLFPADGNALWIVEGAQDVARVVDEHGDVVDVFNWKNGFNSRAGSDGSLGRIERGAFHALTRTGDERVVPLASTPNPYEILVWFGDNGFITCRGATYCRYDARGRALGSLTIQSVGASDMGEAFAAGREGDVVNFWPAAGAPKRLPLHAAVPGLGAFTVVAVQNDAVLVYGQDHAAWYHGTRMTESFRVDDASYASNIFPLMWESIAARSVCATPDGRLLFTASSAHEFVVIGIDW